MQTITVTDAEMGVICQALREKAERDKKNAAELDEIPSAGWARMAKLFRHQANEQIALADRLEG